MGVTVEEITLLWEHFRNKTFGCRLLTVSLVFQLTEIKLRCRENNINNIHSFKCHDKNASVIYDAIWKRLEEH